MGNEICKKLISEKFDKDQKIFVVVDVNFNILTEAMGCDDAVIAGKEMAEQDLGAAAVVDLETNEIVVFFVETIRDIAFKRVHDYPSDCIAYSSDCDIKDCTKCEIFSDLVDEEMYEIRHLLLEKSSKAQETKKEDKAMSREEAIKRLTQLAGSYDPYIQYIEDYKQLKSAEKANEEIRQEWESICKQFGINACVSSYANLGDGDTEKSIAALFGNTNVIAKEEKVMKVNEMNTMVAANNAVVVKEDDTMKTVKTLRADAKKAGIKGYSKMNKAQLLEALAHKAEPEVELTQEEMEALNAPLPIPVDAAVSVGDLPITYDNAPSNGMPVAKSPVVTFEELIAKYTSDEFFNGIFYGCKVGNKFRGGIQFSIVKNNEDVEKKNAEGQRLSYNFISEYVLRRIIVEHITGMDYLDENGKHRLYNSGQIAIFNAVLESVYDRIALTVISENDANGNPTGRRTGCFINAKTVQKVYSGKFARGVKYFFYFKDAAGNTIKDATGKTMCKCYVVRNSVLYTKNERGNKVSYELNDDGFAKLDQQCIFGGLMPTEEKKENKPVAPANGTVSPF